MTILIDPPRWPAHGRLWSHLVSDTSYDELHAFASQLGIPARGFDHDHYDVPQERYAGVVQAGALVVESRELLRRLKAGGLRQPKKDRRVKDQSSASAGSERTDPSAGDHDGPHVQVRIHDDQVRCPADLDGTEPVGDPEHRRRHQGNRVRRLDQ